jgi:hypothetical protein
LFFLTVLSIHNQPLPFQRYLFHPIPIDNAFRHQGVGKLLSSKELENMGKAIDEIGAAKTCITSQVMKDVRKIVLEKGLDAAELYAAQLTGTDQNTELSRVLTICRKNNLSPEAIAQVIDKLGVIESGKW